jgi:hypothetical protein
MRRFKLDCDTVGFVARGEKRTNTIKIRISRLAVVLATANAQSITAANLGTRQGSPLGPIRHTTTCTMHASFGDDLHLLHRKCLLKELGSPIVNPNNFYVAVGCHLWNTYRFAASSELVNLTFDSSQLSFCSLSLLTKCLL